MGCCCPHCHGTPMIKQYIYIKLEVQLISVFQKYQGCSSAHSLQVFSQTEATLSFLVPNMQVYKQYMLTSVCISTSLPRALNWDLYLVTPRN